MKRVLLGAVVALVLAAGCSHGREALPSTQSPLALSRVVLYRNGVGYFERHGVVSGDTLTLKVRKDQVNDLLKSLTVIDRASGKAVSVSIPLDPSVWQNAALATLSPGNGRLADVLDALRGTHIRATTRKDSVAGRIVMVERIEPGPVPMPLPTERMVYPPPTAADHKLTLLDGDTLRVVKLSELQSIELEDGDLAMQLDRHLDAAAGEGMFQQVDVVVRLSDDSKHDLAVSYVAQAPLWKPTYRLVLADDGSGKALLQAWAVVSNVSGENWNDVALGLTSGAPLAFTYDLHTPQTPYRPDLTGSGTYKQANVAMGESTYGTEAGAPPSASMGPSEGYDAAADEDRLESHAEESARPDAQSMSRLLNASKSKSAAPARAPAPMPAAVDMAQLSQSVVAQASAKRVAGLTRFDIDSKVTLPDGSASMVALVNQLVPGEEIFLYKPGGSGQGYEANPYRVVRFKNDTEFVLEPGPISIYAGGSFVGEGLSEAIASRDTATIPFAVESSLIVRSSVEHGAGGETKLVRVVRGVMEVESFHEIKTTWTVEGKAGDKPRRVLARQSRAHGYTLVNPPKDTETLPDGYYVPVVLAAGQGKAELTVIERSPSRRSLTIWDEPTPKLLEELLSTTSLNAKARAALEPIVKMRQAIGRIDTETASLHAQQGELDERANELRQNLLAIQKDPKATALRSRLSQRLEEITKQADALARSLVELSSQRLEQKIALEDALRDFEFVAISK